LAFINRKENTMAHTQTLSAPVLPSGIKASDCSYPKFGEKVPEEERMAYDVGGGQFDLWHVTGYGWVIPTLSICKSNRVRDMSNRERTYAVAVDGGKIVRCGLGPHVTAKVTVYIRKGRVEALKKFLDLRETGEIAAGQIRDRISTRRAQGALYRIGRGW
jgi:hypothetical protein